MGTDPWTTPAPPVCLGDVGARSVSATVFGLLDRGARLRPELAAGLSGRVKLCLAEDYADVLIDGGPGAIVVSDCPPHAHADLEIHASLPDLVILVSAPLAKGVPKPTDRRGRMALARMADGRVDFIGSLGLARRLLRLMSVASADEAPE